MKSDMNGIYARHSRTPPGINSGGEVVHGCTVYESKDGNPVRRIALYLLDPRPPPSRGQAPKSGDDGKKVICLQTLK